MNPSYDWLIQQLIDCSILNLNCVSSYLWGWGTLLLPSLHPPSAQQLPLLLLLLLLQVASYNSSSSPPPPPIPKPQPCAPLFLPSLRPPPQCVQRCQSGSIHHSSGVRQARNNFFPLSLKYIYFMPPPCRDKNPHCNTEAAAERGGCWMCWRQRRAHTHSSHTLSHTAAAAGWARSARPPLTFSDGITHRENEKHRMLLEVALVASTGSPARCRWTWEPRHKLLFFGFFFPPFPHLWVG